MDKLALVNRLLRESGQSFTGVTTTEGRTDEYLKFCDWIDAAYRDILSLHKTWGFLHDSFSFDTVVGQQEYTRTQAGKVGLKSWLVGDVRSYLADYANEQNIYFLDWERFKQKYLFGNQRSQTGPPAEFTIKKNKSFAIWPIPDNIYTINGWCYVTGDDMTTDESVPIFDEDYHMIIVWRALTFYGADYVEADKYEHGLNEFRKIKSDMEFHELPELERAEPLC